MHVVVTIHCTGITFPLALHLTINKNPLFNQPLTQLFLLLHQKISISSSLFFLPYLLGFPRFHTFNFSLSHAKLPSRFKYRNRNQRLLLVIRYRFCSVWRVLLWKTVRILPPGVFWAVPMSQVVGFSGKFWFMDFFGCGLWLRRLDYTFGGCPSLNLLYVMDHHVVG